MGASPPRHQAKKLRNHGAPLPFGLPHDSSPWLRPLVNGHRPSSPFQFNSTYGNNPNSTIQYDSPQPLMGTQNRGVLESFRCSGKGQPNLCPQQPSFPDGTTRFDAVPEMNALLSHHRSIGRAHHQQRNISAHALLPEATKTGNVLTRGMNNTFCKDPAKVLFGGRGNEPLQFPTFLTPDNMFDLERREEQERMRAAYQKESLLRLRKELEDQIEEKAKRNSPSSTSVGWGHRRQHAHGAPESPVREKKQVHMSPNPNALEPLGVDNYSHSIKNNSRHVSIPRSPPKSGTGNCHHQSSEYCCNTACSTNNAVTSRNVMGLSMQGQGTQNGALSRPPVITHDLPVASHDLASHNFPEETFDTNYSSIIPGVPFGGSRGGGRCLLNTIGLSKRETQFPYTSLNTPYKSNIEPIVSSMYRDAERYRQRTRRLTHWMTYRQDESILANFLGDSV